MSAHIEDFTNIVDVTYAQNCSSVNTNELGMREMQARVFKQRASQYLLVKAPQRRGSPVP